MLKTLFTTFEENNGLSGNLVQNNFFFSKLTSKESLQMEKRKIQYNDYKKN